MCDDQEVVVPKSTTEVSQAIKYYYQLQQGPKGVPVKLRVVTRARNFPAADGYRCECIHMGQSLTGRAPSLVTYIERSIDAFSLQKLTPKVC